MPIFLFTLIFQGCTPRKQQKILFQTSTIDALLKGVYDGDMTVGELKKHGDFGLGTVNCLDGEMIGLDGKFYHVRTNGKAYLLNDTTKTPFADVVFFKPDTIFVLNDSINSYRQLEQYLNHYLPSLNLFYAIKISGTFDSIETRSVPAQQQPYAPLTEVVKNQTTFGFHNVKGTLVGFRSPAYAKGINVTGYHFHFLTRDRKAGGHLLSCKVHKATVEIEYLSGFTVQLPHTHAFYDVNLGTDQTEAVKKVER